MKYIETDMWCISGNGEDFSGYDDYSSKEEAISATKENFKDGYVGRCVRIKFEESDLVCFCDETIRYLGETLSDEIGEASEYWEMTDTQEMELSEIIAKEVIKYINENNLQPTCFKVIDIEEAMAGEQESGKGEVE